MTELNSAPRRTFAARWFPNGEWVLLLVLALEVAVFARTGDRFFTVDNAFEVSRLAAEVGLLAFGLTLVIKTGGIDLSVGSMMGLAAVSMGGLWSAWGFPIWLAALAAIGLGAAGGALNGLFVTRLKVPPLIVTLGSFSLYRGLAEAMTGGYVSYSGFPAGFLALGQGYILGVFPEQLVVLIGVFVLLWLFLHRTPAGRELAAIGYNRSGARFAGIRVGPATLRTYVISGVTAAVAAVVYVARIGQAKADAGTGYELTAIAAVVLGGASINGGAGTLQGTLLGLLCLIVLQNGLRLSGQPSEIAGLCAGAILLLAIGLNQSWSRGRRAASRSGGSPLSEAEKRRAAASTSDELSMKNSQVTLVIGAILIGACIIAASIFSLGRSLGPLSSGPGSSGAGTAVPPAAKRPVIAITPKSKADPYFVSCKQGIDEAAAELGVDILWDAPTDSDPAKQNEVVEAWITKGVDVIAASATNPTVLSTVLRKAREKGIRIVSWDSDVDPDARSFFVNQATAAGIGTSLADEGSRLAGDSGQYAIIQAALTDENQNTWVKAIKARMGAAHPKMELMTIHPCDGLRDKAMTEAKNILRAYPGVKVIIAICAPAVPGAAEALKQENRTDVALTGLSTPNLVRDYVHEGWVKSIVLWNTVDLGYLTVYAANAERTGQLHPGLKTFGAGRLGQLTIDGDNIILGKPFVFQKDNIDQFHF